MTTLSIASRGTVDEKLHWAYSMYDMNGDGNVSRKEATEIIKVGNRALMSSSHHFILLVPSCMLAL